MRLRIGIVGVVALMTTLFSVVGFTPANAVTQPGVAASKLPVPADALAPGSPYIAGIACGAPNFCVAVGDYRIAGGWVAPLIETWSGGVWTASRGPAPAGAATTRGLLRGVACAGTTTCAAYGGYDDGTSIGGQMAVALKAGTWHAQAVAAPVGDAFPIPGYGHPDGISGVGCAGADACTLVGNIVNGANQPEGWVAYYHGTGWASQVAKTPTDATGQSSGFSGVSCGGGICQAVGSYISSTGPDPLVDSVDPVAGTVNSPTFHIPLPAGSPSAPGLNAVSCDPGGSCAAIGYYYSVGDASQASNEQAYVSPVGGTAFQPQRPPTATAQSTTIFPATHLASVSCVSGGCLVAGYYWESPTVYHPLLDRFTPSGGWTADHVPNGNIMNDVACGAPTFCLGVDDASHTESMDVLSGSTWLAAPFVLPSDASGSASPILTTHSVACDSASSCWVVGSYDSSGFADHVRRPSVAVTSGPPAFVLGSSASVVWHGTPGSAPIAHYTVQVRRAAWNGGFGAWSTPSGWGALSAATTSVKVPLPVGYDTCVRVQAVDTASRVSAWTAPRCTMRPLDDRALTVSSGWVRASGTGYYLGTYTSTTHLGATMTRTGAQFDQLALVATKCSTCGKVAVYSGTTLLATVNLYRATTAKEVVILLPKVSVRTATVRLRVVTSGKTIQIDGLGVSRT